MATYRIGIGSFNLKDGAVGLGTESSGLGNLKVEGTTKTKDLDVIGVSTFTRYAGFAVDNISINVDRTLTGEHQTTGDIVVGVNSTFTVSTGATVTVGTVESVSIGTHFSPPTSSIEERPEVPIEGTVRFNTDLNTLEFYNGFEWRQFTTNIVGKGGRAVFGGGYSPAQPTYVDSMDYVEIASRGHAQDFGTLVTTSYSQAGSASEVRGIVSGQAGYGDAIEYIIIASKSNGIDFGNLSVSRSSHMTAWNSSTRSIFAGGYVSPGASSNILDYVEINTLGNATDFGDLVEPRYGCSSMSSPVRGVCGGGRNHPAGDSPLGTKMMDYVTIASKGNAVRFGDLYTKHSYMSATGNYVRGIFAGGTNPNNPSMAYITIASEGNAEYFGELRNGGANAQGKAMGNSSNSTRGLLAGGGPSSGSNVIESVQIATTSNNVDFGDLHITRGYPFGLSNSNGGLGGF